MSSFLPTPLLGSSGTSYAIRINQHLLTCGTIEILSVLCRHPAPQSYCGEWCGCVLGKFCATLGKLSNVEVKEVPLRANF